MTPRRSPNRTPAGLLVEWQPTTPADHAAVARIGAANVLAVATQRIVTAVRTDRTADLAALLAEVPVALERLRFADSHYTGLARPREPEPAPEQPA